VRSEADAAASAASGVNAPVSARTAAAARTAALRACKSHDRAVLVGSMIAMKPSHIILWVVKGGKV